MNRRERMIAVVAGVALLVLAGDRWVLTPMLESREALEAESALLVEELSAAQRVLKARRDRMPRWRELVSDRIPRDVSDAEGQLLHEVRSWAREARLTVRSIQPDRPQSKGEFRAVSLTMNAAGRMSAVTEFLYRLQSADMPMHVERVRLGTGEGGVITLDVRLSTLYREPMVGASRSPVTRGGNQGTALSMAASAAKGERP